MASTVDAVVFCPICGDDLDHHRKGCSFEGTVYGYEVVYCRDTGKLHQKCPCQRCEFDRRIAAGFPAPPPKKVPMKTKKEEPCPRCKGSGYDPEPEKAGNEGACSECYGTGTLHEDDD